MALLQWLLPLALAFLAGMALVLSLTVHPRLVRRYGLLTVLLGAGMLISLVAFAGSWLLLGAGLLALLAFLLGYLFMARRFLSREDARPVPAITRARTDPGQGHTAVVYFTHGEPQDYDPIGWINQFREFDEQKIPFVPLIARPLFVYQLRKKYGKVGKSGHRAMHTRMLQTVEQAYRAQGDTRTRFYLSFLDDNPRPDAAVIQAVNEGASRIVVSEVFLTISNHTAEGEELIKALNLEEEYGIPVTYTGPLWESELLKQMFVQRVNANLDGVDKAHVGVLLVGHGQPHQWDVEWPTETEQEIRFRVEVLDRLAQAGYARNNLAMAWMEFREPHPAAKVEEFVANGVQQIFYFSAAISAEAIHSQVDVPELIDKARVPEGYPLVNLGAWNDDPLVIQAIKERIDDVMA